MPKNGFKILDSDMHVLEPADLWQRYIDPEFRDRAPRGLLRSPLEVGVDVEGKIGGLEGKGWGSLHQVYDSQLSVYAEDIESGFDPGAQLKAMEREGIDLAVLFPSRGLFANSFEGIDPRFSDAIARAYNNWMTDFCNEGDPGRMFGAALLPFQDVALSVKETRRAVTELGHKTVFLRAASPSKGVYYHQPEFEPLFAEIQELGVPIVFPRGDTVAHTLGGGGPVYQFGGDAAEDIVHHGADDGGERHDAGRGAGAVPRLEGGVPGGERLMAALLAVAVGRDLRIHRAGRVPGAYEEAQRVLRRELFCFVRRG